MNGNEHWGDVVKDYNNLRNNCNDEEEAISIIRRKYTDIGPINQKRLEEQYEKTKPAPKPTPKPSPKPMSNTNNTNVISTLDLNLLTKGGGSWNINCVNMKKSDVTTFHGKTVVKAVYDKNSGTSHSPGIGGFSFTAVPNGINKNAITFAWEVFYPKGFDFSRGGKHGGAFIGKGFASGYRHSTTGSSNRIMWQENGGVIDYIYPPSDLKQKIHGLDPEGHGIGFFKDNFKNALKYDVWNRIEIGTKMNTFDNGVPQLDGESYVIVNGKKEVLKGINWSRSPDMFINRFDWNNFFGGPLPSPKNQVAYFTNFQMKTYE
jgi:hypothetical protein